MRVQLCTYNSSNNTRPHLVIFQLLCNFLINTPLSLTFLSKHKPLASIFPSKSSLENPNFPQDASLKKFHAENGASKHSADRVRKKKTANLFCCCRLDFKVYYLLLQCSGRVQSKNRVDLVKVSIILYKS